MAEKQTPILSAKKICKRFGGVQALKEVDFECYQGEVHALIGENGAGKSTLVKILCGVVVPDQGDIFFRDQRIDIKSPSDAAKLGIVSVFQELSLVPDLSVAENIFLGYEPINKFGQINFKLMQQKANYVLEELGFDIDTRILVKNLPFADQQIVEIAKVLSKDPEIVLLDEATSALGADEVERLFNIIRVISHEKKKTVVFISHKMSELGCIADSATVFRDAQHISTFGWGKYSESEIIDLIAGRKIESVFPQKKEIHSNSDPVVEICGICLENKLRDISFNVKRGEIVGLGGLVGHGQTEFLDVLFGAKKIEQGILKIKGKQAFISSPRIAIKCGIALTPADRKNDGLLLTRSIKENLALMTLQRRSRFGLIDIKKEKKETENTIKMLTIKVSNSEQIVGTLSGGNQQKAVIGKILLTDADIFLFSDPTRGIDVGTKFELYQLIRQLADRGKAIVFYSTENNELLGLCNRIVVFRQGRISSILEGSDLNEYKILRSAMDIQCEEVQN